MNSTVSSKIETFIDLVKERKKTETQLFMTASVREDGNKAGVIQAVINGRTKEQTSWQNDRVLYRFDYHRDFLTWRNAAGKPMSCRDFATFLEDGREFVHQRKDSGDPDVVTIIETARSIKGSAKVDFEESIDETTGARGMHYAESIKLKGGKNGELEIPGHFTIAVPVFNGDADRVPIVCILRARVDEGRVSFSFKMDLIDQLLDKVVEKRVDQIASEVGIDKVFFVDSI